MTDDILIPIIIAVVIGIFPAIWSIKALSNDHKFSVTHFILYGSASIILILFFIFISLQVVHWIFVPLNGKQDISQTDDTQRHPPSPYTPAPTAAIDKAPKPSSPSIFICHPVEGNFASEICDEMQRAKADLVECLHPDERNVLKMDVISQFYPSELDVSQNIFDFSIHLYLGEIDIFTFIRKNMRTTGQARVQLMDSVRAYCR